MLSKVTGPGLPYILSERRIPNCFWTDFTIDDEPEKRKPRDRVAYCYIQKSSRWKICLRVLESISCTMHEITETKFDGGSRDLHSRGKFNVTYNADRAKPSWMVWIGSSQQACLCTQNILSGGKSMRILPFGQFLDVKPSWYGKGKFVD